jgi:hypothetical protein
MTLPDEEIRSLLNTRQFLVDLLNPRKTPRVPEDVRQQAGYLLKHFPAETERMKQLTDVLSQLRLDADGWERFLAQSSPTDPGHAQPKRS